MATNPQFNPYAPPSARLSVPSAVATSPTLGGVYATSGATRLRDRLGPYFSMWFSPRQTMRWILATGSRRHVALLACLVGIAQALGSVVSHPSAGRLSMTQAVGLIVLLGPPLGLIYLWLMSHLVAFTGRWLGGDGGRQDIGTALAWSSLPSIVLMLVIWPALAIIFGRRMLFLVSDLLSGQHALVIGLLCLLPASLVLQTWSLVMQSHAVAEAQSFRSSWYGLLNLMLAGLVMMVPIEIVKFLIRFGHEMITTFNAG